MGVRNAKPTSQVKGDKQLAYSLARKPRGIIDGTEYALG